MSTFYLIFVENCTYLIRQYFSHDIAETNKLVTMGFGIDGVDRYIVVYKKEHFPPSEDEIAARKNGDEWNEETSKEYAQRVSSFKPTPHFINDSN